MVLPSPPRPAWIAQMRPLSILALPLMLAMIGRLAIATTDIIMLGQLGPDALGATALALSLFHPVELLGIGLVTAVAPLASAARAGKNLREVRRIVRQGVWAILPFTILATFALWPTGRILELIGHGDRTALVAEQYMHGAIWGLAPALLFVVLRCYVTAFERPGSVLTITLMAIFFNAAVNYVLIFGAFGMPRLEVFGAGLGSSLSHLMMALGLGYIAIAKPPFRRHRIWARFWRPDWSKFAAIHHIGLPIGFSIVVEVSMFAATVQLMGLIGRLEVAAHQIALQLAAITFMAPLGIGQAITTRVALLSGARDLAGARAAGIAGLALSTIIMALSAVTFLTIPGALIWPFLDGGPEAGQVLRLATIYLVFAAIFQIADGLQIAAISGLRGLADTRAPLLLAIFSYWVVGFPLCVLLGLYFGWEGSGIWTGMAVALFVAAALMIARFLKLTPVNRPGASASSDP